MNEWLPKFKGQKLLAEIERATAGLVYVSESDAPIEPYFGGTADTVDSRDLIEINTEAEAYHVEGVERFFARLTAEKDWFGPRERKNAGRFRKLEELLTENLKDLRVLKVGRIKVDIYVVGLDASGNLAGIKTKAVET
jgi:hypothetical protein